jgi:hypothetical protein
MAEKELSWRRKRALLGVAAAHLGVAAAGGLMFDWGSTTAGRAIAYYGELSGTNSPYSFFAPEIDAMPWATFEVNEGDGRTTTDTLETGASREADLRTRNLFSPFLQLEEGWQRPVAASMAGKILARHPDAEGVVMRVKSCALPTMEDYRKGARPGWLIEYEAEIAPRAKVDDSAQEEKEGTP